jgi:hypothetical protein
MTITFSEHSYQYIQSWLKNKYKTDPAFRKKKDQDTRFYQLKGKITKKVNALVLDVMAECYINHIF